MSERIDMKKSFLTSVFAVGLISLSAFVFIDQNPEQEPEEQPTTTPFQYKLGPRYDATVTKEMLRSVTSVDEILPKEAEWSTFPITEMTLTVIGREGKAVKSASTELTSVQRELLATLDYADEFRFNARAKEKGTRTGDEEYNLAYYLTVVPEQEAIYQGGNDAFIKYLKDNSAYVTANLNKDQLSPGKIQFTINPMGLVTDVKQLSSSGYQIVDQNMFNLISNAPKQWNPASSSNGEAVSQKLVFFYGGVGC